MKKRTFGIKTLIATVCICVLLCGAVGSTVAWLIAKTDTVINTFTYGDINITLEETDTNKDGDNNVNTNTYPMKPGNYIVKDPVVTVEKDSEDNWLFIKVEEKGGNVTVDNVTYTFSDFLEYAVDEGWKELDAIEYPGVYYREVAKSKDEQAFTVLKTLKSETVEGKTVNYTVLVKEEVTKEMLNALDKDSNKNYPVIEITAYAVQKDAVINTAALAWQKVAN